MKKKIAILGSTGSIGKSLLNIISKDKKNFKIILLSANKNYKDLIKQAKKFSVKNLIIKDIKSYQILKKKEAQNKKIKIFNNFESFDRIFKNKVDYVMSSIIGIDGLKPTIDIIKHTNTIAIANKESIICGWNLINKELKKYKTYFIPIDSEHFSIWYALKNSNILNINKIFLTASGGPLLNLPTSRFKNLKTKDVLNHPNWKMGKKISIDSSTMMNKVFEVIEAKNIFGLNLNKISILIHPKSYVHAIINFNDGMIKVIAHETTMEIPIFNSIYLNDRYLYKTKKIDLDKLNKLNLSNIDKKKFPLVKILKLIPKNNSLFETILVSSNDELVRLYLNKKISYTDISKRLLKIINLKKFAYFKKKKPKKISDIIELDQYVRFKIRSKSV